MASVLASMLGNLLRQYTRLATRLFHMLVGVVFLLLAMAGVSVSMEAWHEYILSPSEGLLKFDLLAGFTMVLFGLCLYTLLKARSVR